MILINADIRGKSHIMDFQLLHQKLLNLDVGDILEYEPIYKHTTYKVGGPARLYVKVKDINSLQKLMNFIKEYQIPYCVIGKGSNILFGDKEYEGIVISLNENFNQVKIENQIVEAYSGVSLIKLAHTAMKQGLSGMEFISGIPGSVGGAIYMNAGAYKKEVSDICKEVTILNDKGEIVVLTNEQLKFSYRYSIVQEHQDWIILNAKFQLENGDKENIKSIMDSRKEKRMQTQPWDKASAGSVFRNPNTKGAWQYIEECQLRGYKIGGAKVSKKHSNFIINTGHASAKDIKDLIEYIQLQVKEKFKVDLHTEVRFMNWED